MNAELYPWQAESWQRFCQQKKQQRLPHAILLTGVTGLAKNILSDNMVASVLCLTATADNAACGDCHSCQLFTAGNHPDHIKIAPEEQGKQIKIDQIRQLKEKQNLTATVSSWKTVIISPADSMNISSSNSLLKLLEEPPTNTLLILVTAKPEKMPITIRSRCQIIHLTSPDSTQSIQWLKDNGDISDNAEIDKILQLAKGAPLLAQEMLKDGILQQYQQIEQDFNTLMNDGVNPVALATSWLQYDLINILNQLHYLLKQRLISQLENRQGASLSTDKSNRLYWQISDCIINTMKLTSSQNNINKTLLIEDFIVSVMKFSNRINQGR